MGSGFGGKGGMVQDNWWQRTAVISPSLPVAIHDPLMPDSFSEIQPDTGADDEFSRLCKSIKNDFDKTVGK